MMYGPEKSDHAIVAGKPTNKAERSAAELVERRARTEGNARQLSTRRTPSRLSVTQMLARIRQHIVTVDTRGGSRMRESRTYGSGRGARGNSRPYRERGCFAAIVAHGRIERMGRFVRSWPKLTCEHSGGIRVMTRSGGKPGRNLAAQQAPAPTLANPLCYRPG